MTMAYDNAPVFSGLSLEIRRGDRVAVVGPNGSGKSTMLKLMAGLLAPSAGVFEAGYNTAVRYFGQHQLEQLDLSRTLYETVAATAVRSEKVFIRNVLGAFLFSGDDVDKKVAVLSGGEKSRLVLATMMANPGNTLLLDEPTNHLDINSIETLVRALERFQGTIVMVSHDDYFVSRIATRIIEVRPGLIRDFPGDLAIYRAYVEAGLWGSDADAPKKSSISPQPGVAADRVIDKDERIRQREQRKKLQRAVEKLEREIAEAEAEIAALKAVLENPANALNHSLLFETARKGETREAELLEKMDEWERRHKELEVQA